MADELASHLQSALGSEYELGAELGGGGMSRVFRARHVPLNREVVIKVLPPELAGTVSSQRFRQEVAVAARLQHPHIVPVLSAGEMGGLPWYSMPFVDGESLRDRLLSVGKGGLPPDEGIRILRDVARGLSYAHEQGVVHRDIKPGNVLLSHGAAAIADFGIARAILLASGVSQDTLTSTGVSLGTPAYMAPEQAVGDPRTDHRADLYAFGVMAYEMFEGRLPFADREPSQQMAAKFTAAAPPMTSAGVDDGVRAIIASCMSPVVDDRPATAAVVVRQLENVQRGAETSSRRPIIALVGAVAVLGAAGFLASRFASGSDTTADSSRGDAAPAVQLPTLPPRDAPLPPIIVRDSTRMIFYAVGASDGSSRGQASVVDSAVRSMSTRVASVGAMAVELVTPEATPRGDSAVRADLIERNARFGVVVSLRSSGDSLRAVAVVHDRMIPPEARPPCEIRGRVVPRQRATDAAEDLASRVQGSIATSFTRLTGHITYGRTRIPILRCTPDGIPYEAVLAYEHYRRAENRRDRPAMLAYIDSILRRDSTSYLATMVRTFRTQLLPVSRSAAAWDSANPPPGASASPALHALHRHRRAIALNDVRGQLTAAREIAAQPNGSVSFLLTALIAANRPEEALVVADAEETRLANDTVVRNRPFPSYVYATRTHAYWLLRRDAAMLEAALKVVASPAVNAAMRQSLLAYALQGALSARDSAAYAALFLRYAPDAPLARANLLANGMSFALAEGDTAAGLALARRVVAEFDHLPGQPDIPNDLLIPLAQAHRRLGNFDRASELLVAGEQSSDEVLQRNARLHLVRVAAQRGDEATVARLTRWIESDLTTRDPSAALLVMARLRATQGNLGDAWNFLREYHARGLTQWQAGIRIDPDLSRLRSYEPARIFFEPVR
jgi:serine/threonine protein kinase